MRAKSRVRAVASRWRGRRRGTIFATARSDAKYSALRGRPGESRSGAQVGARR